MNSVVSLRTFANAANVPVAVFVDMQQEYVAASRPLAISGTARERHNCRKVPDHVRYTGLPVAFHRNHKFTHLFDASTSRAKDVSPDEVRRAVSKISGLYADVHETNDWIASTLPRKLGIGKNAGG